MFLRFLLFLAFWLVLDGGEISGLVIGLPAAFLAARLSLWLQPPGGARLCWRGVVALGGYFLWKSIVAGLDVAWRAFHPRLPVRAGLVTCPCAVGPGPQRDLFLGMASLMPGSVPVGESGDGEVVLHCLDTSQPVAGQMAEHEARFARALAVLRGDRNGVQ